MNPSHWLISKGYPAANRGQIYLHGGMQLWDCAAGTLILDEAGGYASTLDGMSVTKVQLGRRSVVASPDRILFKEWLNYSNDVLIAKSVIGTDINGSIIYQPYTKQVSNSFFSII